MQLDPQLCERLARKVWPGRKPSKANLWNTTALLGALCEEVPEIADVLGARLAAGEPK
ncbi:hypothetical protein [Rhodovarius crocodyli]|uniref:hypothetical protein n=1 Tax=Rhodovarius crocodyli TaxID=1979269 RepID=UPI0013E3AE53|nr:hypothetical protein [Rhodovarius crocodyli]